jgi:methylated-DNA-protein-cysteine methyltransferase related protein
MTEFSQKVIKAIRRIPKGQVATYSQIAKMAGKEHAARAVSWILHSSSKAHKLPWQRVLNSKGKISFRRDSKHYNLQKNLLIKEGVCFSQSDTIKMSIYQWQYKKELNGKIE